MGSREKFSSFILPRAGADVSYHVINWQKSGRPTSIVTGGNIHYHSLAWEGTEPEYREYAQVVFVLSGRISERVNGESRVLHSNMASFVRPGDLHSWAPDEKGTSAELLIFSFALEMFLTLSEYFEDDSFLHKYTESVVPPLFTLDSKTINDLTVKLLPINSARFNRRDSRIKLKLALAELFVICFLEKNSDDKLTPAWLQQLCDLMRQSDNLAGGLRRMQQLSGYTPEYLCKVFRKYLNKTPTEFLNELRIDEAAKMLSEGDKSIGEIAFELNFHSLSRFYHLFRQFYGISPAQYRAKSCGIRRI